MDFVKGIVEVGVVDDVFVTDLARVEIIGGDTIRYTLTARQEGRNGKTINVVKARMIWSFKQRIEVEGAFVEAARLIREALAANIGTGTIN